MRISDGSSDVCSSDLRVADQDGLSRARFGILGEGAAGHEQRGANEEAARALRCELRRVLRRHSRESGNPVTCVVDWSQRRRHRVPAFAGMTIQGESDEARPAAHSTSPARPCPASCPSMKSDSGCRAKSEEHTSELQSLMRISYAVFCL